MSLAVRIAVVMLAAVSVAGCGQTDREGIALVQGKLGPDETTPIGQKWKKLGGLAVVGDTTGPVQAVLGSAATYQTFTHGVIVYSNDFGAVFITQTIFDKWFSLRTATTGDGANLFNYVGVPIRDSVHVATHDDGTFERGMIIVEPGPVARVVYGEIYLRYLALASDLGLPRSEEASSSAGGRYQVFEDGEIHWKQDLGAFAVSGPILDRWSVLGGPNGTLGFPKSDTSDVVAPDTSVIGEMGRFENGVIFWSAASGAWELTGKFLSAYEMRFGGPAGWLGFPIGAQGTSGAGDPFVDFQGGVLVGHGTDADGTPTIFPFGELIFHLQRVVALGDDCGTCGAQDLYYYVNVSTSNGVVVAGDRVPDSDSICQGCDSDDPNRDIALNGRANSAFTVSAAIDVWDDDDSSDDDHLGTPSETYSINNLWGYLETSDHRDGDGFAQFNIKTPFPFDSNDFRGQMWWSFHNFSTSKLTYDQFAQTFVDVTPDEATWRHPFNKLYYEIAYKGIASNGNCFGMTLESIYAQIGRSPYAEPIHQYFPDTQDGSKLTKVDGAHASLYNEINVKSGYQLGVNMIGWTIGMFVSGETHDPMGNFAASLLTSTLGDYPLISIFDDFFFGNGHSVRPYKWDPIPQGCTRLGGPACVRIHIADSNFPTGISAEDDFIEIDVLNNVYDYRDYRGSFWEGGHMFFQPFRLFSHPQYTPFANPLELLKDGYLLVVGSTGKTKQITDASGRTFFEPGLVGVPQRWDQIRQDTATRVPDLAPVMITDALTSTMPVQMYAGRGTGATHAYDLVPAAGTTDGTPIETTFESGRLSAYFSIPGTTDKPDTITARDIGTGTKDIAVALPASGTPKPITFTVAGSEKQRWAELTNLGMAPGQKIAIRLENAGYHVFFDNNGPATTADLTVKAGPNATPVSVGTIQIPNGQSTTQFQLPVTTLTVSGEVFGQNGWLIAPVTVTLTAKDFSSQGIAAIEYGTDSVNWTVYSMPFVYANEGQTTLFYRARDNAQDQELAKSREFKIDTRKPVVAVSTDQAQYTRVQAFTVHFSATDPVPGSGLAQLAGNLDGTTVSNGDSIDLLFYPLGAHTVSATAKDVAGWSTTNSASFQLIATIGSVQDLIRELRRRGEIDSDGVMNSLLAKAQAAAASIARGNRTAALNQLGALLNELAAQSGKHITARGAAIASADVQYVMAHLP